MNKNIWSIRKTYVLMGICCIGMASCSKEGGSTATTDIKISVNDALKFEGDAGQTELVFPIQISDASASDITFDFKTEDVTAAAGSDYLAANGTIVIKAGDKSASISVQILTDTLKEEDEQFALKFSNAKNAILNKTSVLGTLRNDDNYLVIPDEGYITPSAYTGYDLAWNDEFEGNSIDGSFWTHELGNNGWGNNELQNYTSESKNSYVTDGNLLIEARKESNGTYTSARMVTKGKKEFTFGRIDIRAKVPTSQGIWPALWMLGKSIDNIGWPACGEIDIMELVGKEPNAFHTTAHWGNQGSSSSTSATKRTTLSSGIFSDKYHVFSLIWENNKITWLLDDSVVHTITPSNTVGFNYPFNSEFFFIFNVAVGGNWPGNPDASTVFPQRMAVDYIRVFNKK